MSVKLVLVAACALIDADGRVLIAERPAGKAMAGLWEFPGGKVEAGERPEETLIRELKEELGIVVQGAVSRAADLREPRLSGLPSADAALCLPALGRTWSTAQEGQRLAWVRPNKLRDYPMPPADEPLIAHLTTLL